MSPISRIGSPAGSVVSLTCMTRRTRPVIGARSGGIPDAVDEDRSGLLVPPDDVEATTDALARVLGDPMLARRLGEGGRHRATAVLSWDHAARAIFELVGASLAADRPPR